MDRCASVLVDDDVGVALGDEHVPRPGVELQRDLVRERRGRQEQRRLLAEEGRCPLLQEVDRSDPRAAARRRRRRRRSPRASPRWGAWPCPSGDRSPRAPYRGGAGSYARRVPASAGGLRGAPRRPGWRPRARPCSSPRLRPRARPRCARWRRRRGSAPLRRATPRASSRPRGGRPAPRGSTRRRARRGLRMWSIAGSKTSIASEARPSSSS